MKVTMSKAEWLNIGKIALFEQPSEEEIGNMQTETETKDLLIKCEHHFKSMKLSAMYNIQRIGEGNISVTQQKYFNGPQVSKILSLIPRWTGRVIELPVIIGSLREVVEHLDNTTNEQALRAEINCTEAVRRDRDALMNSIRGLYKFAKGQIQKYGEIEPKAPYGPPSTGATTTPSVASPASAASPAPRTTTPSSTSSF